MTALHIAGHDGTDRGDDAVALAKRLAGLYGAELLVVHVTALPPERDRFGGSALDRADQETQVALARARDALGDAPGPAPRVVFASSPAAGLHQVCEDEGAGMVSVGSSRRGALGRVLAGMTAERLLTGAPCPVAVAPVGYASAATGVARVIAAYDGGPEAQLALDVAADLARRAGVRLHIATVAERLTAVMTPGELAMVDVVERSAREAAQALAAEADERVSLAVPAEREVLAGEPARALAAAADAPGDLMVIGSRRYGPLRSVVIGTVGHHLCHAALAPVLVVPRGTETGARGEVLDEGDAVRAESSPRGRP